MPVFLMRHFIRIALFLLIAAVSYAGEMPVQRPVVFDLEWGKGNLARWDGSLYVENGQFVSAENTLLEGDEKVTLVSARELIWTSSTAGPTDGIRVKVLATPQTVLRFESPLGTKQAYVRELIKRPQTWKMDRAGHELAIRRTAKDAVSLITDRSSYIFKPGEKWNPSWNINLGLAQETSQLTYRLSLYPARVSTPLWSSGESKVRLEDLYSGKITQQIVAPQNEGVYTVKLRFDETPAYLPEQTIQFVVLDPNKLPDIRPAGSSMPTRLVDQLDATLPFGKERFRDDGTSRIIKRDNVEYRLSGGRAEKTYKALNPDATLNWFAYQLKIEAPGKPHILELDYPDDERRQFTVRIAEKNPVGLANNILDLGIVTHGIKAANQPAIKTKRIVFWPTTKQPAVAFINALAGGGAAIQRIRVYEVSENLTANYGSTFANNMPALRGPYFEEASLQRSLGGTEVPDPGMFTGHGTRPDWQTYYDTITHLCQLVRYRGENAVMLTVYTYGATLYPSTVLPNNGRYDSGVNFTDGRDPIQKDVVRLILELFERYHITLTPVFAFYTALPSLDAAYPEDSHGRREIDLLDKNGKNMRQVLALQDGDKVAPFYNPLHPAVQSKIQSALKEFTERYKDSSTLGDIAIQINTTGWTQFPGLSWGYDLETLNNFARDRQMNLPSYLLSKDAYQERYDFLTSRSIKPAWVLWRNTRLARFYNSLADTIQTQDKRRKLVLAYMNTFTSRYAEDDAVKAMATGISPRELLAVKGVDPIAMKNTRSIRIWRPLRTPIPYLESSAKRSMPSRQPASASLFQHAAADGIVEFNDYFETNLNSIRKNWWFPMDDWVVATIIDSDNNKKITPNINAHFYGGWEIPQ